MNLKVLLVLVAAVLAVALAGHARIKKWKYGDKIHHPGHHGGHKYGGYGGGGAGGAGFAGGYGGSGGFSF